jgi:hypothetical protein
MQSTVQCTVFESDTLGFNIVESYGKLGFQMSKDSTTVRGLMLDIGQKNS